MAKRALTVTQIKMYEEMVEADFKELMDQVATYRIALKEKARVTVAQQTGLYELKMLEKKLELQMGEVKQKIESIEGTSKWNKNEDFENAVIREVSKLLGGIGDGALADIEATYEHFLRKVRLAGVTDEVRAVFETDLPAKIKELTAVVKLLPPAPTVDKLDVKLLTMED